MNWDAIAALAELLAAVAVLASLVLFGCPNPPGVAEVVVESESSIGVKHRHVYRVHGDGHIEVENTFRVPAELEDLPRLGVVLELPAAFDQLRWFGRGPHESYWDRRVGAAVGLHRSTVASNTFPTSSPRSTASITTRPGSS